MGNSFIKGTFVHLAWRDDLHFFSSAPWAMILLLMPHDSAEIWLPTYPRVLEQFSLWKSGGEHFPEWLHSLWFWNDLWSRRLRGQEYKWFKPRFFSERKTVSLMKTVKSDRAISSRMVFAEFLEDNLTNFRWEKNILLPFSPLNNSDGNKWGTNGDSGSTFSYFYVCEMEKRAWGKIRGEPSRSGGSDSFDATFHSENVIHTIQFYCVPQNCTDYSVSSVWNSKLANFGPCVREK